MANTDQKLVVSELDFAQIKNNLKNFLREQQEFTDFDFEAAGINVLLDILAYNTHYMAFYNNMIANEMFLDTALMRDSVVSHAKMLGYTPRSSVAPRATIDLQVIRSSGTQSSLTLPRFTRFQSLPINGASYTFVNYDSKTVDYDPTCNRFCFHDIYIYQGQPLSYTFTYNSTNNPNQNFELPDAGIDTSSLEVVVQESGASLRSEKYILSTDATSVTSNSAVYFLDESRNGKYKIYFGDGVIGKSLTNGNLVTVTYIVTDGALANKANAFSVVDTIGGFPNSIVYPVVAASGGDAPESTESVRSTSTKAYAANGRGVTKNDLIALINKNYPYFESVNVWGGEENDPPVYGKVFIAAKPTSGYDITETEKLTVINDIIKPVSVVTVSPEFIDVDYNYLKIFADVYFDQTKTNRSTDSLKSLVRSAIVGYKNAELNDFNSRFKISRLLRRIDDSETSIQYSDAIAIIEKRFTPQVGASRNYTINFGTSISREDPQYKLYSSPAFKQYDDEFNLRSCFFEETPGTSSGIDSIDIIATSASKIYDQEPSPTVTIIGDGVGAAATAIVVNGKITSIRIDDPGVNYTTATAYITYLDEVDTTVALTVNIQNRYGVIRSYYVNETTKVKTVLNPNAGEIDYILGKITLTNFDPVSIEDPLKIFKFFAKPQTNNFESSRNRIITIDEEDSGSITVTVKAVD